jgi:hypothetical protein
MPEVTSSRANSKVPQLPKLGILTAIPFYPWILSETENMLQHEGDKRRSMICDMAVCWDEHDVVGLYLARNIMSCRCCLRIIILPELEL